MKPDRKTHLKPQTLAAAMVCRDAIGQVISLYTLTASELINYVYAEPLVVPMARRVAQQFFITQTSTNCVLYEKVPIYVHHDGSRRAARDVV